MSARRAAAIGLARSYVGERLEDEAGKVGNYHIADVRVLAQEFLALYDEYSALPKVAHEEATPNEITDLDYRQMALGYATSCPASAMHDVIATTYLFKALLQGRDKEVLQAIEGTGGKVSPVMCKLVFGE